MKCLSGWLPAYVSIYLPVYQSVCRTVSRAVRRTVSHFSPESFWPWVVSAWVVSALGCFGQFWWVVSAWIFLSPPRLWIIGRIIILLEGEISIYLNRRVFGWIIAAFNYYFNQLNQGWNVCLASYLPMYLSICLSICLSACLSECQSVGRSVGQSVGRPIYVGVFLYLKGHSF